MVYFVGAGSGAVLLCGKQAEDGMTVAIAERGSLWGRFM